MENDRLYIPYVVARLRERILKAQPGLDARSYAFRAPPDVHAAMRHLLYILDDLQVGVGGLSERVLGTREALRRLGFVQGVLWTFGFLALADLAALWDAPEPSKVGTPGGGSD